MPVVVHIQHVLVLPRPRLRSCRRPFTPSPPPGPYRLPRPVLDRLQAALQPARNREAALSLAVFLGRFWSAPGRLGQAFQIDRRALVGHRDLDLTEARVRGAIRALEEVGYLERIVPEPGRRYQRTPEGLHRQPLAYRFGDECRALFAAAHRRPGKPQDGRRPLPGHPMPAARSRPPWSPPTGWKSPPEANGTNSPKSTSPKPAVLYPGELVKEHPRRSAALPETSHDPRLEAALERLGALVRKAARPT